MNSPWEKDIRTVIFISIYEDLFWSDLDDIDSIPKPDWETLGYETDADLILANRELLDELFEKYELNREHYLIVLKKFLVDWDKTHTIVQACMLSAMLELYETQVTINTSITPYLRLVDKYDSSTSVSVIHAVLSKALGIDTTPVSQNLEPQK
jgi:transcription termination factor NusB